MHRLADQQETNNRIATCLYAFIRVVYVDRQDDNDQLTMNAFALLKSVELTSRTCAHILEPRSH